MSVSLQAGDITADGLGLNLNNDNGAILVESGSITSGGPGVYSSQDGPGISIVQVVGDVVSTGDLDSGHEYVNNGANLLNDGFTVFYAGGSVISEQENGLVIYNFEDGQTVAVVEDTISGAKDGVTVMDANAENGIDLTVWKIEAGDGEIIHEFGDAEKFAPTVRYIVKLEQPEAGGTIAATDAEGNPLEHYNPFGPMRAGVEGDEGGWDVAHEGDKVLLKVELEEGYRITGAYNGIDDEKVELLFDGENYYVVVPRGGGIYLSVELSNEYDVTFTDEGGKVLQAGKVEYGKTPAYEGATPTKAEDDDYTYEFIGWKPEISPVTGDVVYVAQFKATPKTKPEPAPEPEPTPEPATPAEEESAPVKASGEKTAPKTGDETSGVPAAAGITATALLLSACYVRMRKLEG